MNDIQLSINNLRKKIEVSTVFVAVSGGIDSMLLLDLIRKEFPVTALHVNYQLRGIDSDLDSTFVQEFCKVHAIPIKVLTYDLGTELKNKKSNLQNRAREIRYDFFNQQLEGVPNSYLFIGHHADDQIETFFIQYFRSAGISGLAGMKEISNRIVRPFLSFSKNELQVFAQEIGLTWREDQSNKKNDYIRNKFRNLLLPNLEKEIPTLRESVLRMMNCLQENQTRIEKEVELIVKEIISNKQLKIVDIISLEAEQTIELFRQLGISTNYLSEWKKLIDSQKGIELPISQSDKLISIIREEHSFYFNFVNQINSTVPGFEIQEVSSLPEHFSKSILYFDKSKIKGAIFIRLWQQGDRIFPIGLAGSKLISDVLTNAKVPHARRKNQWVLCDDEKILSCINHCVDRRAIASSRSKAILRVSFNDKD